MPRLARYVRLNLQKHLAVKLKGDKQIIRSDVTPTVPTRRNRRESRCPLARPLP